MPEKPRSSPFAEPRRPGPLGRKRAAEIRQFLLENVRRHPSDLVRVATDHYQVSRQAINKQIRRLIEQGFLTAEGRTQGKTYALGMVENSLTVRITPDADEHEIWNNFAAPFLRDARPNVRDICQYGFTEMVNNVIDHSESALVRLHMQQTHSAIKIGIADEGIGIFNKLQRAFGLADPSEAIFELSKGKLTTDPERHTGEGIFFTSRMFDEFGILSANLYFGHQREADDWLMERNKENQRGSGTSVFLEIDPESTHTTKEVFDRYATEQDDYAFKTTKVVVRLAQSHPGDKLVSRSQAKRVLARLNRFQHVIFDFSGVESIGPAFADEIFRVYGRENPNTRFTWTNVAPDVERMITRAVQHG